MTPPRVEIIVDTLGSDPDLEVGGFLLLQRADGRSLWQQRFVVKQKYRLEEFTVPTVHGWKYCLSPVDEWGKPS